MTTEMKTPGENPDKSKAAIGCVSSLIAIAVIAYSIYVLCFS